MLSYNSKSYNIIIIQNNSTITYSKCQHSLVNSAATTSLTKIGERSYTLKFSPSSEKNNYFKGFTKRIGEVWNHNENIKRLFQKLSVIPKEQAISFQQQNRKVERTIKSKRVLASILVTQNHQHFLP